MKAVSSIITLAALAFLIIAAVDFLNYMGGGDNRPLQDISRQLTEWGITGKGNDAPTPRPTPRVIVHEEDIRPNAADTFAPFPTPGWIPPKPAPEPCPVAWGEPMPPGYNRPCIETDPPVWLNEHLAR